MTSIDPATRPAAGPGDEAVAAALAARRPLPGTEAALARMVRARLPAGGGARDVARVVGEVAAAHPELFLPSEPPRRDWLDLRPSPGRGLVRRLTDWRRRRRWIAAEAAQRARARPRRGLWPRWLWPAAAAAGLGSVLLAAVVVLDVTRPPATTGASDPGVTGSVTRPSTPAPAPAPAPATSSDATPAAVPAPEGRVSGVPDVLDTTTMRVAGTIVRLEGLEWARGGNPDALRQYVAGREVECRPAATPDTHACSIGGRDLATAVLYNGGARATPQASPTMKAAESQARARGVGVWRR